MNKMLSYIKNGRGIGALWLLAFALLFSFWSAYHFNKFLPTAIPYIQQTADELLPIKIEKSQVVEPQNTIKSYTYTVANEPFVITIDTTKDVLEEGDHPTGLYLTKSYFYAVNDKEIRRQKLAENLELPKQDYRPMMKKVINWTVSTLAILGPLVMFVYCLIGVLFYAFCSGLACVLNKTELSFKAKMRLNSLLFIAVYFIFTLIAYLGLNLSTLAFFCVMIALQIVTVKQLKA